MFWLFGQLVGIVVALFLIAVAFALVVGAGIATKEALGALLRGVGSALDKMFRSIVRGVQWITGLFHKVTPEERADKDKTEAAVSRLVGRLGGDRMQARKVIEQRLRLGYDE